MATRNLGKRKTRARNKGKIKGISDEDFRQLNVDVAKWYDDRGYINMLKLLYRDNVSDTTLLQNASQMKTLLESLYSSGDLGPTNLKLLYETINVTQQFGLKQIIEHYIPSCPNIQEIEISKFNPYRQKLMKLGFVMSQSDVQTISELYNDSTKRYDDSWSLINDLEHRTIICEKAMKKFIKKLKKNNLCKAVAALCEGVKVTVKRKWEDDQPPPEYVLDLLKELDEHKGFLPTMHIPKGFSRLRSIFSYYKDIGLVLEEAERGSIIFHISTHDPNALMNLWEIHSSGKLIKDIAEILVPEKHQQEFLDEWMTYIDENEYEAALTKLKGKALEEREHGSDDDEEEEDQAEPEQDEQVQVFVGYCLVALAVWLGLCLATTTTTTTAAVVVGCIVAIVTTIIAVVGGIGMLSKRL